MLRDLIYAVRDHTTQVELNLADALCKGFDALAVLFGQTIPKREQTVDQQTAVLIQGLDPEAQHPLFLEVVKEANNVIKRLHAIEAKMKASMDGRVLRSRVVRQPSQPSTPPRKRTKTG